MFWIAVRRRDMMACKELDIEEVTKRIGFPGKRIRKRPSMDERDMIGLLESIQGDLPITVKFSLVGVDFRHFSERESLQSFSYFAEIVRQRFLRLRPSVHKNEPFPGGHGDRKQAIVTFLEVIEHFFVGNESEPPFRGIGPAVEFAAQGLTRTLRLPHQFIASMGTDIM